MKKQKGFTIIELMVAVFFFSMLIGWSMNIYKAAKSDISQIDAPVVLRFIGIVVPPLGIVMGFIPCRSDAAC